MSIRVSPHLVLLRRGARDSGGGAAGCTALLPARENRPNRRLHAAHGAASCPARTAPTSTHLTRSTARLHKIPKTSASAGGPSCNRGWLRRRCNALRSPTPSIGALRTALRLGFRRSCSACWPGPRGPRRPSRSPGSKAKEHIPGRARSQQQPRNRPAELYCLDEAQGSDLTPRPLLILLAADWARPTARERIDRKQPLRLPSLARLTRHAPRRTFY